MSLLDMQRALCRVLTDSDIRMKYLNDAGSALAGFDLSAEERTCLTALDRGRLQRYADMLLHNRLDLAFKALPRIRSCFWLEFIGRHAAEYAKKYPPVPVCDRSPMIKEVFYVKNFLYELLESEKITIPAFENVLRYESQMFFLANEPKVNHQAHVFEAEWVAAQDTRVSAASVPVVSPAARIETFNFDVLRPLEDEGGLLNLPRLDVPMTLVFHKRANAKQVRVFRASRDVAALLRACDGVAHVEAISEHLSSRLDGAVQGGSHEKCIDAFAALRSTGLLYLSSRSHNAQGQAV